MKVSSEYLKLSKYEGNNYKHDILFYNLTKQKYITDEVLNEGLSIRRAITDGGNITPNEVTLLFNFDNWSKKNTLLEINDLIQIIDVFNNERVIVYEGVAYKISMKETYNGQKIMSVNFKDLTINGYEKKFLKKINYEDIYYFNNQDKEHSIFYILAKEIGFQDSKIHIEDIKFEDDTFIKLPTVVFEKGQNIMQELVMLVFSVCGNIYVTKDGVLKITSILNQTDTNIVNYTLDKSNIIEYIEKSIITPKNDKVSIKYNEYVQDVRQPIFILAGQNFDYVNDDARVNIKANQSKSNDFYKIGYIEENIANIDKDNVEVKVYRYVDKQKQYIDFTDYEIDFDKNKLRFWNSNDYEVFVEKFKIYGEPIKEFKDNEISYTEKLKGDELEYNILSINNKYINTHKLAQNIAKYKYFLNCREIEKYKFVVNSIPFIELEDVIYLDYCGIKTQVQVVGIIQFENKTELEVIKYDTLSSNKQYYETHKNNAFNKDFIINTPTSFGSIKLDTSSPPKPLNLKATSGSLGILLKWTEPSNYKEIKGYNVYYSTKTDNSKIFVGNCTDYFLKLNIGSYKIQVTTINLNGDESEKTSFVSANVESIDSDEIKPLSIKTEHIEPLSIDNTLLSLGSVDGTTIKDKAITSIKIAANAVESINIKSNSISADKIQANAITSSKIQANSISADKIQSNSITGRKIKANTITGKKIKANSIDSSHILSDSITSDKIQANAINSKHIEAYSVAVTDLNFNWGKNGIGRDYKYNSKGEIIGTNSESIAFNGNVKFLDNVQINGKITGNNRLEVLSDTRNLTIEPNSIRFAEKDLTTNQWYSTKIIKKQKQGVYHFNPDNIEWIDIRDFPSQNWGNIKIDACVSTFTSNAGSKSVFCNVIRNETNKHLFYIEIGASSTALLHERNNKIKINKLRGMNVVSTEETDISDDFMVKDVAGVSISAPESLEVTYRTRTNKSASFWYDNYEDDLPYHLTLRPKVYIRYKAVGNNNWGNWEQTNYIRKKYLCDFQIKIKANCYIEDANIKYQFYKHENIGLIESLIAITDLSKSAAPGYPIQEFKDCTVRTYISSDDKLLGGSAFWIATEY